MLARDIPLLCCADCGAPLALAEGEAAADGVLSHALLCCQGCGRFFPVVDGVAVLFRREMLLDLIHPREVQAITARGWERCLEGGGRSGSEADRAQVAVADNWSYQWEEVTAGWTAEDFRKDGLCGAAAFWNFIPVEPSSVRDATVLVACGGLGRETFHLLAAGAGRVIVNEIGTEIYRVPQLVPEHQGRLLLVRSDLRHLPVASGAVDLAICDHALQHVVDHGSGFAQLVRTVRPGGRVAICVYSWEGNLLMTHAVEPAKAVLHRLPLKLQRWLSLLPTVLLWAVIHGLYRPAAGLGWRRLPLFQHMLFWSEFPFGTLWMSIFDLIHAPVSYHFRKDEVEGLARANILATERLAHTNGTLWSLVAAKAA